MPQGKLQKKKQVTYLTLRALRPISSIASTSTSTSSTHHPPQSSGFWSDSAEREFRYVRTGKTVAEMHGLVARYFERVWYGCVATRKGKQVGLESFDLLIRSHAIDVLRMYDLVWTRCRYQTFRGGGLVKDPQVTHVAVSTASRASRSTRKKVP